MCETHAPSILVVEDDPDLRETIVEILGDEFRVSSACDGREALSALNSSLPDLVLSDVGMPHVSGFEMLETMRAAKEMQSLPVIMLSAKGDRESIRRGMELGADDYIPKPFRTEELLGAIRSRLSRQSALERPMSELRETLSLALPHEFRTPLNGILGFASLIQDIAASDAPVDKRELSEFADHIVGSGTRLLHLVEKFTFHARLLTAAHTNADYRSQAMQSEPGWTSAIREQVVSTAAEFGRSQDVSLDMAEAPVTVEAVYLSHLVGELLENALAFSESGSAVSVRGWNAGERYVITVQDSGRGMSAEQVATIGPYVQFDRKTHEQQGLGLGLAIVSQLARLHDGIMRIDSTPGEGTTVEVSLPVAAERVPS
jgi:signal transduction histidine kinase